MKLIVGRESALAVLKWVRRGLFGVGICALGYSGYALMDAWYSQKTGRDNLAQLLARRSTKIPETSLAMRVAAVTPYPLIAGGLIGRLDIPRLGLSVMVAEGVTPRVLRRALGHIPGTALPGGQGNIGISGHRDTFLRPLRNIRENDLVTLTMPYGTHQYRVVSTSVVRPDDVSVLRPDGSEILTLITCHPFYFVGPAPDRFIVRAVRVL